MPFSPITRTNFPGVKKTFAESAEFKKDLAVNLQQVNEQAVSSVTSKVPIPVSQAFCFFGAKRLFVCECKSHAAAAYINLSRM
jgi:hypothetical protein